MPESLPQKPPKSQKEIGRPRLKNYVTENRERFVRYLSAGIKQPGAPILLGVEIEHFVVFDDGRPVSYERHDSALGIREVLEYLSAFYPDRAYGTQGDLFSLPSAPIVVPAPQSGIAALPAAPAARPSAPAYDLSGRRIVPNAKGIYIIDGKKVVK